jgi:hypothetical protein
MMKLFNLSKTKRFTVAVINFAAIIILFSQPLLACSWDYLIWENRAKNSDPYYRFIKNGKAGFIDQKGKVVIEPILPVRGNYQEGIINELLKVDFQKYVEVKTGKEISEEFYEQRTKIVGDWIAKSISFKYGFVDSQGRTVIEPNFVYAKDFSEGLAPVVLKGPCLYQSSESVCPGSNVFPPLSQAKHITACQFNFINKKGNLITAQTFLDAKEFSEGLAAVKTETGWGYINRSGKVVVVPRFESAESFSGGLGLVKLNGLYGYVSSNGKLVVEPQFDFALSFAEGLALVGEYKDKTADNSLYYIDKNAKPITTDKYLLGSSYFKGIAHVLVSEEFKIEKTDNEEKKIRIRTYAYIKENGEKIFTYTVEDEM